MHRFIFTIAIIGGFMLIVYPPSTDRTLQEVVFAVGGLILIFVSLATIFIIDAIEKQYDEKKQD